MSVDLERDEAPDCLGERAPALIDLLYKAAVEPSHWIDFVGALSESCGGAAGAISLQIPTAGMPIFSARVGLLDEYAPVFTKHARIGLPWGSLTLPIYTRQFGFGSEILPNDQVASTRYYKDYMEPQGLAPEGPLAHIFAEHAGRAIAAIVLYRRVETRPLDWRDLELCNELVPHLSRVHRIHSQMYGERERRRALASIVDRFPIGVLLLDKQHRCVIVNQSAKQLLEANEGIGLQRERPVALDSNEDAQLHAAISAAAQDSSTGIPGALRLVGLTRPSGGPALSVMVAPLLDVPTAANDHNAVTVLFITDPAAGETQAKVVEELYSFTPAEAALVCQLVVGSLEEAAKICGVRKSTARGYLKSVYQKTGTRSQRDLVRLVLTGVAPIRELDD